MNGGSVGDPASDVAGDRRPDDPERLAFLLPEPESVFIGPGLLRRRAEPGSVRLGHPPEQAAPPLLVGLRHGRAGRRVVADYLVPDLPTADRAGHAQDLQERQAALRGRCVAEDRAIPAGSRESQRERVHGSPRPGVQQRESPGPAGQEGPSIRPSFPGGCPLVPLIRPGDRQRGAGRAAQLDLEDRRLGHHEVDPVRPALEDDLVALDPAVSIGVGHLPGHQVVSRPRPRLLDGTFLADHEDGGLGVGRVRARPPFSEPQGEPPVLARPGRASAHEGAPAGRDADLRTRDGAPGFVDDGPGRHPAPSPLDLGLRRARPAIATWTTWSTPAGTTSFLPFSTAAYSSCSGRSAGREAFNA